MRLVLHEGSFSSAVEKPATFGGYGIGTIIMSGHATNLMKQI